MATGENMKKALSPNRIFFLDEVRGFAVACMVFYHAFFLLGGVFGIEAGEKLMNFFMPVQPLFAAIFILISGISCRLTHNNLRRGIRLLLIAAGFTLVTAYICPLLGLDGLAIYFGILHFLSVSMLIFSALRKLLDKTEPHWGLLLCVFLYAFTAGISEGTLSFGNLIVFNLPDALYNYNFLAPLGIYSPTFSSADYFPLFPNIFIFLTGSFLGVWAKEGKFPSSLYASRCPFFGAIGRKALVIYVIHQPLIFAVVYVIELIINKF